MSILATFFIALLVSGLLSIPYRGNGSWVVSLIIFFFVLFLAGLAGNYWITPFGPMIWGVSWLPLVFIIGIVGLLFSAPSPHYRSATTPPAEKAEVGVIAAISIFTWILFVVLLIAVFAGYFQSHTL